MVDYALAYRCARLCQEIYRDFKGLRFETLADARMTLIQSNDAGFTDTQVALLHNDAENAVYVIFRGSDKSIDWMNNFQFRQQIYPYGDGTSDVRFHRGFMAAYFAIRKDLLEAMGDVSQKRVIIAGHSLGGAVATIAALDIQYNITSRSDQFITAFSYGSPRVGNKALVESFNRRVPDNTRFVYGWDMVTRIPRTWQGYDHVAQEVLLGSLWTWQVVSRRFSDHDLNNYINALAEKAQAS